MTGTDHLSGRQAPPIPGRGPGARVLALGTIAGPALFTLGWVVLGFRSSGYTLFGTRIPSYSPVSQPISGLGMGRMAPFMNTIFVLNGLLICAGILGVFRMTQSCGPVRLRRASTALLLLIGAGSMIDGLFTLESMKLHSTGFFLATGTPVISFLVAGKYFRRIPQWRRFGTRLLAGSPVTLALFIAFFLTFTPTAEGTEHGIAGLVQRCLVLEVFAWLACMGYQAWRTRGPEGRPPRSRAR